MGSLKQIIAICALALMLSFGFSKGCLASVDASAITDKYKDALLTRIETERSNGYYYYIVYHNQEMDSPCVCLFTKKPDFAAENYSLGGYEHVRLFWYEDNKSSFVLYSWSSSSGGFDNSFVNEVVSTGTSARVWACVDSSNIYYSNVDLCNENGTVFFPRSPLKIHPEITTVVTSVGAVGLEQVIQNSQTVEIIAIGTVILFPLLALFLKKSLNYLV